MSNRHAEPNTENATAKPRLGLNLFVSPFTKFVIKPSDPQARTNALREIRRVLIGSEKKKHEIVRKYNLGMKTQSGLAEEPGSDVDPSAMHRRTQKNEIIHYPECQEKV